MNAGDTAWVLVCAALVMFMTPGLALFYGGMVRVNNVLTMIMQNIIPLCIISLTWVIIGYTLAFSNEGNSFIGNVDAFTLLEVDAPQFHTVVGAVTIPTLAFVAYQMMFAVITPALLTGAVAGRLKLFGWVCFLGIWSIVVYPLVARWLWAPQGWLADLGAQDWAGGMVVHASAGAAAIAVLLVVGRRKAWSSTATPPNNLPLMVVGAGILWFGWFGFNAGDGLQANAVAAQAMMNTHIAASAGMLTWLLVERITSGRSTLVGAITGAVAGLATITPCAGYVSTGGAVAIGLVAGLLCNLAVRLKFMLRYDDALDVIAVHFLGGVLGTLLLGFFGSSDINPVGANGVFYGGGGSLLWHQVVALVSVVAFSLVVSWIIAMVVQHTVGLREPLDEQDRLDEVQQGAAGYALGDVTSQLTESAVPARTNGHRLTAPTDTGDHGRGRLRLVTATVGSTPVDELRDALLSAGAQSLELTSAAVYTGEVRSAMFRGKLQESSFHDRLRVEVLVDEARLPDVVAALNRAGVEPRSIHQQEISSV